MIDLSRLPLRQPYGKNWRRDIWGELEGTKDSLSAGKISCSAIRAMINFKGKNSFEGSMLSNALIKFK
jgi:hypothetical protein